MPIARVHGLDLAYEERGTGDPVVLIPPTGADRTAYVAQAGALEERYRCVLLDNRDSGRSAYVDDPYTPRDLAADAAGVMDHLGIELAHVVGYSLGGAAAMELAIARPDLVRSLVLVSTWPASDPLFVATMRNWQAIRRAAGNDQDAFYRALSPWLFSAATFALPGYVDGFVAISSTLENAQRPDGFLRQCEADVAHDAAGRLGRVRAPAIVLVGDQDVTTPPRFARALCDLIPESELATIPETGHAALWERPDVVNDAILGFLEQR